MSVRLQQALPAILAFLFGLASGVVVGWVAWAGKQTAPQVAQAPAPEGDTAGGERMEPAPGQEEAGSEEDDPQVIRQRLAVHVALLEKNPEDVGLLRAVGNYHGLLGEQDEALAVLQKAEGFARKKGENEQLVEILTDEGIAHAEKTEYTEAFAKFDEAGKADPADTRSRLTAALVLMDRIMPAPPPGWDRKEAVTRAESILREVLAIDPNQKDAIEMLGMITSIRGSMSRGGMPHPPMTAPAAATGSAPPP